jgi:RHS repeat-associated protein
MLDGPSVLEELDAANAATTRYLNNPQAIDEVLAYQRGSQTEYPLTDALGSLYASTDASGAVVHRYEYDVYGVRSDLGGTSPPIDNGYTGRRLDANGLYENGNRQRRPQLGSWMQPDRAGMIDGPNSYAYVRATPTMFTDPSGNDAYILWNESKRNDVIQHWAVAVDAQPYGPDVPFEKRSLVELEYSCSTLASSNVFEQMLCLVSAPARVGSYSLPQGLSGGSIYSVKERFVTSSAGNAEALARLREVAGIQDPKYNLLLNSCQDQSLYVASGRHRGLDIVLAYFLFQLPIFTQIEF